MFKIDEKLLDELAQEEVKALVEGMQDPELRHNPRFLEKVRKYLKDNELLVTPETPGVSKLQEEIEKEPIPEFNDLGEGFDIDRVQ
jgi:hypothetical protein